jgi:protein tyrosine phosphatase (PTP) superfamily phosphohydrolase (DUF442 family)
VGIGAWLLWRSTTPAPRHPGERIEATGLHNVLVVTDKLYSGSVPEGEEGFRSLQKLGIKTILSVDGARPDVELARQFGLRYAHIPVGYDGIRQDQAERLARAAQELPGPIYLHCHHGKHRGPAAAAAIKFCLDPTCGVADAVAIMKEAGTDPHYAGLYAAPTRLQRPTSAELAALPAEFPEVAEVPALAGIMVQIDQRWDHLQQMQAAGWKPPASNPDLDPAHEALQLVELYREATRLQLSPRHSPDLTRSLADTAREAADLERALRARDGTAGDHMKRLATSCRQCHATHRDVP